MSLLDKKKIPIIAAVCASVAVVGLVVFSSLRPENMGDGGQGKTLIASQSDVSEKHIYKKYSDQFMADADIVSPYHEQADVLLAKSYQFDNQKIVSLLFGGDKTKITKNQFGGTAFDAQDTAGRCAYMGEIYLNYSTKQMHLLALPFENFSTNEEFVNFIPRYFEVYKKESLSFMTPDEAVNRVKDILKGFGITVSDDVEIHALDKETMQEYQDYIIKNDPDMAINYDYKAKLTDDDEFYFMCFNVEEKGIPVTRYNVVSSMKRFINGSNIKVCYSKDGIIDFQTDSIYTVKKVDHTAKNLLTAEQALDKAYEEFTTVYTPAEITVEQMRFEYAPKAYNSNYDEVKLVPVWSMIVYQKDNNPEADEKRAIKRATEGKVYDENYHSSYAENRHVWIIDAETGDVLKKSI